MNSTIENQPEQPYTIKTSQEKCLECDGTGELDDYTECDVCLGTGVMQQDSTPQDS